MVPHIYRLYEILLTCICLIHVVTASISIELDDGEHQCFKILAPKNITSVISGNYDMIDDHLSPHPVHVEIYSYENQGFIYESPYEEGKGFYSITGKGKHKLCVYNGWEGVESDTRDGEDRIIGLTVRVRSLEHRESSGNEAISSSLDFSSRLHDKLLGFLDHMEYLKAREYKHRELTESTFTLLWRWTLVEAFVLVGVAFIQIFCLRNFFETKRFL